MTTYTQGDIVTLTAFVELPVYGDAQVIVKAPNEAEDRTQIHKDAILSVEKGSWRQGVEDRSAQQAAGNPDRGSRAPH
jgi:hypothetical protein